MIVAALVSSMVACMSFSAFAAETEVEGDVEMVEATADVNGDGDVTSADITAVYDILLGVQ